MNAERVAATPRGRARNCGASSMAGYSRALIMAVLIGVFVWYTPAVSTPLAHALQSATDYFDRRPEHTVLFIGNSRTSHHDMPFMLRRIADSARSPELYRIVVQA